MEQFRFTSDITIIGDPTTPSDIATSKPKYETTKDTEDIKPSTEEPEVPKLLTQAPISQTTESNETTSSSYDNAPTRILVGVNVLLMLRT